MEGVICWPPERINFSVRPSYADFGGQFIPRVTAVVVSSPFLIAGTLLSPLPLVGLEEFDGVS